MDGVDSVFVDKLSSENYKRAFSGRKNGFLGVIDRGKGAVDF
jgi:hypothetical protein